MTLHQRGHLEEARSHYKRVISKDPRHFRALHGLGVLSGQTGQAELAVSLMRRAVTARPDLAATHGGLGDALGRLGRHQEAVASYDRAIVLAPDFFDAHHNRGLALQNLGRSEEAVASYDRALRLRSDLFHPFYNRGVALQALKRHEEALASYDQAIARERGDADAHNNRGIVLGELKRHDAAVLSFDRAIALRPDSGQAHDNRGVALHELGRFEDALASYDRAISLNPGVAGTHQHRAGALGALKRHEEALASYDRAIALQPDHAEALVGRGMLLLLLGDFAQGWRDYEWRRKQAWELSAPDLSDERQWRGTSDLQGKRIFVFCEQGLGDTIQFSRYVHLLRDAGADVLLSVQRPLQAIMSRMFPWVEFLAEGEAATDIDVHCPLLNLPLAFGTTLQTIPPATPRLVSDQERRAHFQALLGPRTRRRIGIAWSGNPNHKNDRNRSIAFQRLTPVLTAEADWVCLQNEIRESDVAAFQENGRVGFHGDKLGDFADTAALVELMDLVVTVDTSIAHLAGVMRKPVWILLPFMPDWRWMLDRADSPWYPSARLFRQPQAGDWESVISDVRAELSSSREHETIPSRT
jgi:tetratricopeptide (TPR) repeat protein